MVTTDPFASPALLCLDFDGTLVDTRPLWEAAYRAVADAREHRLPPNWWGSIAGKSMDASAEVFGVYPRKEQKIVSKDLVEAALVRANTYPPIVLPGAKELFARADAANIACCIVTSTWTELATVLAAAAGFPQTAIIGGDQVTAGKPAPDIYLKATRSHGVSPMACVAIEDSPSGVLAAYTAGLAVYVLGDHSVSDPLRQRSILGLDAVRLTSRIN